MPWETLLYAAAWVALVIAALRGGIGLVGAWDRQRLEIAARYADIAIRQERARIEGLIALDAAQRG